MGNTNISLVARNNVFFGGCQEALRLSAPLVFTMAMKDTVAQLEDFSLSQLVLFWTLEDERNGVHR